MAYSNFYARFHSVLDRIGAALAAVFRFSPSWIYFGLTAFFQLLAWAGASYIFRHLSSEVAVLHYNVDFGIDLIGPPARLYWLPALGLAVALLNLLIIALKHQSREFKLFARFLWSASVIFNFFLDIAIFAVYLANFR
jgi:hypothetical protein